jgi:branched-chain amino acid transport system ATP-binding protein
MLEVEGLRVAYGAVEAVHGISFSVESGQVVALIGANGAGKTSTLAAISGVVRPSGGRIRLEGRDLTGAPTHQIFGAGVVQIPEGREVLARMTVEENLLLGSRGRGGLAALRPVYDRFPILFERRAMPAGNLSGGEQQMLAIGRALVASPRLLLLDEPSLGLAPKMVAAIFEVLADLKRQGVTMLLVEQNALRALRLADRAFVMDLGRLALSGTGEELLADERVVGAYLGG